MSRRSATASGYTPYDQLGTFDQRVEELKSCRLMSRDYSPSFSIKADRFSGVRFENAEPDVEELRSFLLTFRQFISESEPIFIQKIYNICQKHLRSDWLKENLIEARKDWASCLEKSGIALTYNGKRITPEYVTDLWINGYYFHNDVDKQQKLRSILPHERLLTRYIFLEHVLMATRNICYVGFVVKVALRDNLIEMS